MDSPRNSTSRLVNVPKIDGGFGFTLRHFVVYPQVNDRQPTAGLITLLLYADHVTRKGFILCETEAKLRQTNAARSRQTSLCFFSLSHSKQLVHFLLMRLTIYNLHSAPAASKEQKEIMLVVVGFLIGLKYYLETLSKCIFPASVDKKKEKGKFRNK